LPHGLYDGGLDPSDAATFAEAQLAGRIDLEHFRGRCAYPFFAQAAEVYLRRHLGLDQVAALPLVSLDRHGTESEVVFDARGEHWRVRVHTEVGERRQLTCRAAAPSVGQVHRPVSLSRVE
jgi:hypothetical protein